MTHFRLLAGAASIALACSSAPLLAGEISGIVADASDVDALQAAEVTIVELGRRAVTNRDGSYLFTDVPEGSYTVVASYVGAEDVRFTVNVPEVGRVVQNFAMGQSGSAILVIGQSANQASALSRKRAADGVSDVLTRDAIGQFPDQNVAESLRRLPGINVLNDQGEGRFVAVRGLDPNLNATSINGVRVPAPEGDIRAVALDVVASEIIESIEVKKSLTPDMDADTIGASIEINTASAFDRREDLYALRVGGSYNELRDELTPDLSGIFSTRVNDNFGITGGISFYNRKFQTDNIEADDWQLEDGQIYSEELQYRDYLVERERISLNLGFDIRAGDSTDLYLRGVWSRFDDQEFRRRLTFGLGDANVSGTSPNPVFDDSRDPDDPEDETIIEIERDVKDRFERQQIRTVVFGGESDWGNLRAEYSVSWAKSTELEDQGSVDPAVFLGEFEDSGLGIGFDYTDLRRPGFSVTGNQAFFDPSVYALDEVELVALSDAEDEEFAGQFDLAYDMVTDSGVFTIQGGAKARFREKTFNGTVEFYENDEFALSDFLGEGPSNTLANLAPLPGLTEFSGFFRSNIGQFEFQEIDSTIDSANEDYTVEEDIIAAYLLGRWESDDLLVIGGVRWEHTDNTLTGNQVTLVETDDDEFVTIAPLAFERTYDHFLPSLNIRYEARDDLILRLAGYRSLVRPNFEQLAPRADINEDNEASIGNPNLNPTTAWNIDATVEYYMTNNGAITAGFFYKDLEDYLTGLVIESPGTLLGIDFEEAETFINGESAEIYGFEFSFFQQLDFLPGFLDGTLVQFNYTYTDASGLISDSAVDVPGAVPDFREIQLPATSENTFNAVLGYDKYGLNLRLAGTYRDGFLDEINGDGPDFDRFTDDHFQLDFTARYQVTDNVQVYYEWININDAKFFAFNNLGGRRNLLQYEEYNWTMKGGVRLTF